MAAQLIDGAIDCEALGYTTEIDLDGRMRETDAVVGKQFDRIRHRNAGHRRRPRFLVCRQLPQLLQRRGDTDIERARRAVIDVDGHLHDLIGPWMNLNSPARSRTIETGDV